MGGIGAEDFDDDDEQYEVPELPLGRIMLWVAGLGVALVLIDPFITYVMGFLQYVIPGVAPTH